MTAIWELKNVTLRGKPDARLSIENLQIAAGVTAVLGQSGAGKSSLLSLLAGFESASSGQVSFSTSVSKTDDSFPPRFWSPQDQGLWSHLTVLEHVEVVQVATDNRSAIDWLKMFDLDLLSQSMPGELSLGERSRLAVLRALASQTRCLILDEPLTHVDEARVDRYWQVVEDHVKATQSTCVFSSHDAVCVRRFADNCICLENGKVAFSGSTTSLYFDPPTESTAWLLGPANFDPMRALGSFLESDDVPNCIRPEELRLVAADDGHVVRSSRPISGAHAALLDQPSGTTVYVADRPTNHGRLVFEPSPARP
jgi:iron(III) transport system ATP-binding protein